MRRIKVNLWIIVTIALVVALALSLTQDWKITGKATGIELSDNEVAEKAIDYINKNLVQPGTFASVVSVEDLGSIYEIITSYQGQQISIYTTKDGSMIFLTAYDTSEKISTASSQQETPKSDKPVVKLFVMSQCPYGTIVEKAMEPVVDLLGNKIDVELYFIANDNGDGTFRSLHGQPEVDGDIRQVCIDKYYSTNVLFDYLVCVAEDYINLDGIWKECAVDNGIDVGKIKTCFEGTEGKNLLSENVKEAEKYQVTGSPTLIINGQKYYGERTPEAYKQAICSGFNEVPKECSQTLSATGGNPSGGCE